MLQPDDRYDWVSTGEAARRLGCSRETIRRQIREGTLEQPHERLPRSKGSRLDRFLVGFPKGQGDAPRPVTAPQDATPAPNVATAVLDAYERGRAAQRQDDALRRHEDATRIVRQARRIGRLLREVRSLDATAALLAQQLVESEQARAAQATALDAARGEVERLKARPWWRRMFG